MKIHNGECDCGGPAKFPMERDDMLLHYPNCRGWFFQVLGWAHHGDVVPPKDGLRVAARHDKKLIQSLRERLLAIRDIIEDYEDPEDE